MLRQIMLMSLMLLASAGSTAATRVFINDPSVQIADIDTLTLGAKYRVSSVNFDQSLDSGGGTQNVAGGQNFISTGLSNDLTVLNNRTYGFTLRNLPGQGMIYSLTSPANVTTTLAWGSFDPALTPTPTVLAAQLRAAPDSAPYVATNQPSGTLLSPGFAPMNALHIEVSSRLRTNNPNDYQPTVTLSNLAFTASGINIVGALDPEMIVTPATSLANVTFPDPGTGFASQWLVTNGNFWNFGWTLSGNVNAAFGDCCAKGSAAKNAGDFGEQVKFGISGKTVTFTGVVPEPSSWALLIAGFGLVGAVLRRRRMGLRGGRRSVLA